MLRQSLTSPADISSTSCQSQGSWLARNLNYLKNPGHWLRAMNIIISKEQRWLWFPAKLFAPRGYPLIFRHSRVAVRFGSTGCKWKCWQIHGGVLRAGWWWWCWWWWYHQIFLHVVVLVAISMYMPEVVSCRILFSDQPPPAAAAPPVSAVISWVFHTLRIYQSCDWLSTWSASLRQAVSQPWHRQQRRFEWAFLTLEKCTSFHCSFTVYYEAQSTCMG